MWEKRRLVCTNRCGKWPGTVAVYQMWIQSWLRVSEQERDWHRHGDGQARESQGCPVRGVPWTFIKHTSSQSLSNGAYKTSHGRPLLNCFVRTWSRGIGKGKFGFQLRKQHYRITDVCLSVILLSKLPQPVRSITIAYKPSYLYKPSYISICLSAIMPIRIITIKGSFPKKKHRK